ncbi:ribonuclease PH [Hallerella porci]|uniref:Ribonuclease PH n=1 Tax=Hallerella porci TaxID=1945871 RepID=A0ABX5LSC9_9BACT|nr:ribonuclease PH [Hallerella porci]PWL03360.1 RNAse PH [Hallerella porci]
MERIDGRQFNETRPVKMTPGFISSADGSVLIEMGNTRVICNATLLPEVPAWLAGKGRGWITAEYSLLPQSTGKRVERERKGASGRTQEIQRLIGRSLRGAADLNALGENAIVVDCDVIQADGGTRTASIIGGFVALALALKKIKARLGITQPILKHAVTAISVGVVHGEPLLDLCYIEDSAADVDMNIVMRDAKSFIEIQGTGEHSDFDRKTLDTLIGLGEKACREIYPLQMQLIGGELV